MHGPFVGIKSITQNKLRHIFPLVFLKIQAIYSQMTQEGVWKSPQCCVLQSQGAKSLTFFSKPVLFSFSSIRCSSTQTLWSIDVSLWCVPLTAHVPFH